MASFVPLSFSRRWGRLFKTRKRTRFVSRVKTAHRWLGVVHASYGIGCLVGPLIAAAIASARPEKWTRFYWLLVGLGVTNLMSVAWTFRRDLAFGVNLEEGIDPVRHKRRTQRAWEETKATLKEKVVWLLSLFFFFHLGVGITVGGKRAHALSPLPSQPFVLEISSRAAALGN